MLTDTITAICTPLSRGAIGIIRISGSNALSIAKAIFRPAKNALKELTSHKLHYGYIVDNVTEEVIDEVLLTYMKAPATYTREDIVEINCHSGLPTLQRILQLVLALGARLAQPGEFTLRAFLNGRIDLAQAEAVIDIINARCEQSAHIASRQLQGFLSKSINKLIDRLVDTVSYIEAYIDFPEDDIPVADEHVITKTLKEIIKDIATLLNTYNEARLYKEGIKTIIIGKPNVGKSSLLNALLMKERAIVTDKPGTTRDLIEENILIKGIPIIITDTAGIREAVDSIEVEGINRAYDALSDAELVLAVFDASSALDSEDQKILQLVQGKKTIYIANKTDLALPPYTLPKPQVNISAKHNVNLDALKDCIFNTLITTASLSNETPVVSNLRHAEALQKAKQTLEACLTDSSAYLEIKAMYLRDALNYLSAITGKITTEDILQRIFSQFCIGK